MAMASEQTVIDVADSSMEDKETIQYDEIWVDAMRFLEIIQIIEPLSNAQDHLNRILDQVTKKPYIYRVPHRLREVNKRAYEPNVISIGPYHHGNERLKRMEAIKLSCFLNIVWKDSSVGDRIVRRMQSLEARVRLCYEEPSDRLDSKQFVEMMVYDGCFIVQLIRKNCVGYIFKEKGTINEIVNDLLLLENQLPFFVLSELYHIIAPEEEDVQQLADHALSYFRKCSLFHLFNDPVSDKEVKHLLHLVHRCQHPSASGIIKHQAFKAKLKAKATESDKSPSSGERDDNNFFSQMVGRLWNCMHRASESSESEMMSIPNATELYDAGINFSGRTLKKKEDMKQVIETEFDIEFRNKTLMIPTLIVDDTTERMFRNYIAYEQLTPCEPFYFCGYLLFMDSLINTSKDVQLLRKNRVVKHLLGDDEAVAKMFNKLMNSVCYSTSESYYVEIFERVDKQCNKSWNTWKRVLKRDYFNSPWSHIKFFAATVLLLLTVLQTIISLLSYLEQKK